MDDLESFESPKILISGAKTSIENFTSECSSFIDNCTYDIVRHIDPQTEQQVIKLRFHHRIPPKMRIAASHVVNDLRHALDHSVCEAAVLLGRANGKGVYFPFGRTQKNLDEQIAAHCKNVHTDLIIFIRTFKPHYGGDDLLYALSALAGQNKHQHILRISRGSKGFVIESKDYPWMLNPTAGTTIGISKWNDLRNELEFIRFGKSVTGNIDARPVIQVVLGTGEAPLADPAPTVLNAFAGKVEGIVLGIEAETRRIIAARL